MVLSLWVLRISCWYKSRGQRDFDRCLNTENGDEQEMMGLHFAEILTDRLILRRIASNRAEIKSGWVSRKFRWMSFFVNGDRFSSEVARNKRKSWNSVLLFERKKIQKSKKQRILMESHWRHVIGVWNNGGEAVRQKVMNFFLPPKTVDHFS